MAQFMTRKELRMQPISIGIGMLVKKIQWKSKMMKKQKKKRKFKCKIRIENSQILIVCLQVPESIQLRKKQMS